MVAKEDESGAQRMSPYEVAQKIYIVKGYMLMTWRVGIKEGEMRQNYIAEQESQTQCLI